MTDIEVLIRIVMREPAVWVVLLGVGTLLAAASLLVVRGRGLARWRLVALVAACYAFALLPATTLVRDQGFPHWRVPDFGSSMDLLQLAAVVPHGPQDILNVVLLAPFGLLAVLATGRPLVVLAIAFVSTVTVESVQGASGLGAMSLPDAVHNVTGAVLGVVLGLVLLRATSVARP